MLNGNAIRLGIGTVFVLFAAVPVLALRSELETQQYAVLTDTSDVENEVILLQYEMPESLVSTGILYAQLLGQMEVLTGEGRGTLKIDALPITTEWDENTVTWTYPWTWPGGDLDTTHVRSFVAGPGDQSIRIDLTHVVREWLGGSRQCYGVALRRAPHCEGGFSPSKDQGNEPIIPTLRIWYVIQEE
jgi:hypothetical protein